MNYSTEQLVEKARNLNDIIDAHEALTEAVNAMRTHFGDDPYAASYWLASLEIATSSSHSYVTRDTNAQQAIVQLARDIKELYDDEPVHFTAAGMDLSDLRESIDRALQMSDGEDY